MSSVLCFHCGLFEENTALLPVTSEIASAD